VLADTTYLGTEFHVLTTLLVTYNFGKSHLVLR